MSRLVSSLVWLGVALLGAGALGAIALWRGESVNGIFFVVGAGCTYLVAYRFYSAFLAAKVLSLDATRATPAERLDDGRDFVPTNRWVVLGHHFAAIAGPGPLVGPTLAAQFGYLPGTLWLVAGAVLGGCVQDFVILFFSLRRDGRSLGQIARDEVGRRAGLLAMVSVLAIMVILLAVIALVFVNALKALALGRLHHRHDHPDRDAHGPLHALLAPGPRPGGLGHRLRPHRGRGRGAGSGSRGRPSGRPSSPSPAPRWPPP